MSADLKQGFILTRVQNGIQSTAFDSGNQLVYISFTFSSIIQAFSLKNNIITSSDQDPIQPDAQLESASYTKHDLKLQPETKDTEELHGVDQLAEQSSSSQKEISYEVSLIYKKDIMLNQIEMPRCLAVLCPARILVADNSNNSLTIVNIHKESVIEKMVLHIRPFDVTVLPKNQAAVTFQWDNMIVILSTVDMSTICSIRVEEYPSGITYHQDKLYVVYQPMRVNYKQNRVFSVLVLNLKGEYLREIVLDTQRQLYDHLKSYIAVSKDQQSLYITDWINNAVIRYSLQGRRTAEYQQENLINPERLTMLDDGSLLVCSLEGTMEGTIHHISADLKQGRILTWVPSATISIAYDSDNQLVYISSGHSNIIKVYSVKKNPDKPIGQSEKQTPGESVSLKAERSVTATEKNQSKCNIL